MAQLLRVEDVDLRVEKRKPKLCSGVLSSVAGELAVSASVVGSAMRVGGRAEERSVYFAKEPDFFSLGQVAYKQRCSKQGRCPALPPRRLHQFMRASHTGLTR